MDERTECPHDSRVGLSESGEINYPEQEGLLPGQERCTSGCGRLFQTEAELRSAQGRDVPGELECLERHGSNGTCTGEVTLRESLSGTGTRIPRCDGHWKKRLKKQAEHEKIYPDSSTPPAWFDPTAAGERWNED